MDFPLFTPSRGEKPTALVNEFKEKLKEAELVIISTPEYLHNIPAVLKNAFEFVTTSGEFFDKRVLVITYTPHAPRGEKAMLSLLASLDALKTKVVAQLPLYQSELRITDDNTFTGDEESIEALKAVFEFLQ
jgi:chromate reductase